MLELIIVILLVFWLLGLLGDIGGGLVHFLLVVVAVLALVKLIQWLAARKTRP
jgi:hypothetical protein